MIGSTVIARLVLVALLAASAACGVRMDESARRSDAEEVPFGLIAPDPGSDEPSGDSDEMSDAYLVRDGRLWPVARSVPPPASAGGALSALLRGPTRAERADGFRTELTDDDVIGSVREGGGVVQVDATGELADLPLDKQMLAIAQIVLTTASVEPGAMVALTVDGEPASIPLPSGRTTSHPVGRDDYTVLLGNST